MNLSTARYRDAPMETSLDGAHETLARPKLKTAVLTTILLSLGLLVFVSNITNLKFDAVEMISTSCPEISGYVRDQKACSGKNEGGIFDGETADSCAARCAEDSGCISFEFGISSQFANKCQLSHTCYINDAGASTNFCLYEGLSLFILVLVNTIYIRNLF